MDLGGIERKMPNELHIGKKPENLKLEYTGRDKEIRLNLLRKLCLGFGNFDSMDGSCDYCFKDNKELFEVCREETYKCVTKKKRREK
jgi:hypothetical protein